MNSQIEFVFSDKKEFIMQNKRSVIVLQTTQAEANECAIALQNEFSVVGCFCSGLSGAKAIEQTKPDFVITSLVLKEQDGFAVLLGVKNSSPATKTIVLGEFSDSATIMRAIAAGADYYMLRPVNYKMLIERMKSLLIEPQPPKDGALFVENPKDAPIVAARALDITMEEKNRLNAKFFAVKAEENLGNAKAEEYSSAAKAADSLSSANAKNEQKSALRGEKNPRLIDEKLSQIFISIGMPPNIKGYSYLREAIKLAVKTPEVINSVTKKLYPAVAQKFTTSASKVERAIRHAIEVAWNKGRVEVLNSLFGVRAYSESEKPTNSEFIALIADRLLLDGFN